MQFLILVYVNIGFQLYSLPHQLKSEQLEKLEVFKTMLERLITFLQVSENKITPSFKEKLGSYEKQIVSFLNPSRFRRSIPNLQFFNCNPMKIN
jgi:PAX-interacting protein 1